MGNDLRSERGFSNAAPDLKPGWTRGELLMWRFRWVIALGTLTCLIATGLVTWNGPRSYRVRAVLHTGDLRDDGKEVDRLVGRINAQAALARVTGRAGTPGVSAELRPLGIVELVVIGPAREAAISTIKASAEALLAELNRLMDLHTAKQLRTKRLAEELRAAVERMRTMQETLVRQPRTQAEAASLATLVSHLSNAETRLTELDAQVQLLDLRQDGPRLVVAAEVEPVSIRRRLAVNLAISLVVGLAASLAMALAWQSLQQGARRTADRA